MTALTHTGARLAPFAAGRFTGIRALARKDITEWLRGRRAWIVAVTVSAFMVLTAANGWINKTLAATLPDGTPVQFSMAPDDNLLLAVGAQVFILATLFAVASLFVGERATGTLAWVASKPVGREAIWASKLLSSSVMLGITAAIAPLAATVAIVTALYGVPSVALIAGLAAGMVATVVFFAAVGLAAGTLLPSQPAVAAVGFGVLFLVPILGAVVPFDVNPYLPMSILSWAGGLATGAPVSLATPVAWLIGTGALVAFSLHRVARMEL
jgi:ABC-type transport system involved in multi-copper enzyme maturation permease subunit